MQSAWRPPHAVARQGGHTTVGNPAPDGLQGAGHHLLEGALMENFKLLARGIDVQRALAELAQHAALWKLFTARQDTPGSAHHDTECIVLRGPREVTTESVFNDLGAHWLPYLDAVPELPRAVS